VLSASRLAAIGTGAVMFKAIATSGQLWTGPIIPGTGNVKMSPATVNGVDSPVGSGGVSLAPLSVFGIEAFPGSSYAANQPPLLLHPRGGEASTRHQAGRIQ
jgi:hypothetical protein